MWARIEGGQVAELIHEDPAGRYHFSIDWQAVPAELRAWALVGYLAAAGGGVEPPLPIFKDQLKASLQDRRWREMTRGVPFMGYTFQTDAEGRANLTSAAKLGELYEAAFGPGTYQITWQAMDGFPRLDLGGVYAAGLTVGGHVQGCFSHQSVVADQIDAAATWQAALAAYLAGVSTGWP